MQTFGKKLRLLRSEAGLTQQNLAKQLGIEQSTLSYLENDRIDPSQEILKQVSRVFNYSIENLLNDLDKDYVRKHLDHSTTVATLKLAATTTQPIYNRQVLWAGIVLVIGVMLFLLGFFGIIKSNEVYFYNVEEFYTKAKSGLQNITSLQSNHYVGNYQIRYPKNLNEPIRILQFSQVHFELQALNKLLITCGVLIVICAMVCIILKDGLSRKRKASST